MSAEVPELHAVIVESLSELEDSYRELNALEVAVFSAIDDLARTWAGANGWFGTFDYHDSGNLRLAPAAWKVDGEGGPQAKAWFHLDHADGEPSSDDPAGDAWDLTRLCQARSNILCFQVWPEWKVVGLKLPAWKRAARAEAAALQEADFSIGGSGTVYRQLKLDASLLAQAMRDQNIEDALGPVEAALEQMKAAVPAVESVIAAAVAGAAA